MTTTLRRAQQAVEHELEQLGVSQSSSDRLARLQKLVGDLLGQAKSLVEMMTDSGSDAEPVNEIEELADVFSDAEARIAARRKAGRG